MKSYARRRGGEEAMGIRARGMRTMDMRAGGSRSCYRKLFIYIMINNVGCLSLCSQEYCIQDERIDVKMDA